MQYNRACLQLAVVQLNTFCSFLHPWYPGSHRQPHIRIIPCAYLSDTLCFCLLHHVLLLCACCIAHIDIPSKHGPPSCHRLCNVCAANSVWQRAAVARG